MTLLQRATFGSQFDSGGLEAGRRDPLWTGTTIIGANAAGQGALFAFHPDICRYLLDNSSDPNRQKNVNGASVLAGLSYAGKVKCVKLLLSESADPKLGRR